MVAKTEATGDADGGASPSRLIDARIAALGGWRGAALARVRALVHEALPDVAEEWKWDVPVWSHGGLICTGEAYKAAVKLTFARGAALPDPQGLFNASLGGGTRRAIDVREGAAIDGDAFKALVQAAARGAGDRAAERDARMTEPTPETRSVVVERELPFPPDRVWRALTQPHLIAEWLMPNDFEPVVGRRFDLRGGGGPVACRVLAVEPNRALSYAWEAHGLQSVVAFTLTPTPMGTRLRMEQSGFRPDQRRAEGGAGAAWRRFLAALEGVLARTG